MAGARNSHQIPDPATSTTAPPGHGGGTAPQGSLVERIAGWSARHRAIAITGWFALVVVALLASFLVTGQEAHTNDPGGAGRAERVLNAEQETPPQENVLVQPEGAGGADFAHNAATRATVTDLVSALRATGGAVSGVDSPLEQGKERRLVAADGRSVLVSLELAGPPEQFSAHFDTAVKAIDAVRDKHPGTRLAQAGDISINRAVDQAYDDDLSRSEVVSLPLTLVILLIVFGALIAAGLPLLLAVSAILAALGFIEALGHWVPINSTASSMVLLIGLAVGTDYCLFYLRREREERAAGRGLAEALRITAATSGRAVVVSGVTVLVCLSGLFLTGMDVFRGLAIGTAIVVGLTVVASVTVLPALLATLRHRVDSGRIPWLGRRRTAAKQSRAWAAIAQTVVRRPLVWGGAATLALLLLATPALHLRLHDPAATDSLPRSIPTIDAAARMQQTFPGGPSPALVVVWGDAAHSPQVDRAVDGLRKQAAASHGELSQNITSSSIGDAQLIKVPLTGSGTDAASNHALDLLRDDALPATLGTVDDIDYAVSGDTAVARDFTDQLNKTTPLVVIFVLAVAFILLLVAFRSLAVPVISIVLNLLSVAAAYGAVTWVFQDGHLSSTLDFTRYGGVVSWLPLFLFVVLFGLSMDYHIFILSRIRERRLQGAAPRDAIVSGISTSAGVITSAAVIMVAVFTIFLSLTAIEYKMLGLGMAVAVLLDATVVRGVLLPAVMATLGPRMWTLPKWLRGLERGNSTPAATGSATPTTTSTVPTPAGPGRT